jgi:hypothetical protein
MIPDYACSSIDEDEAEEFGAELLDGEGVDLFDALLFIGEVGTPPIAPPPFDG